MLRNYLSAALRNLARNRLYAGITIAGLAIGFAAAMLIGLFVRDEYSYDKFIPGYQRVYRFSETIASADRKLTETEYTPTALAGALRLDFPQMDVVARYTTSGFPPEIRRGQFSAAQTGVAWADPEFFRLMPFPTLGGDLAHALDAPDSIVLDRTMARKYFGRDVPIGETLLVDKHPMRVTAVIKDLPSDTHLDAEIFVSGRAPWGIMMDPSFGGWLSNRVSTYFRLRPGASVASIGGQLPAFIQRHFDLRGDANPTGVTGIVLTPVNIAAIHLRPAVSSQFTKASGDPAVVAAIAAVGVLIILVAAINFVTLMTARAARRAVEVGVRKSAGATRGDLIVQFMGEAFVYVLLAGIVAVALAELALPAFNALVQRQISFDYLHDPLLAAAIVGVLILVAILAGAYPALVMSGFRPAAVLKGGPAQGASGSLIRQALVIVQFSVLIALMLVAGTIYRQTMFSLNEASRLDKAQVMLLFAQPCSATLRDEVQRVPGVVSAACSSAMALALADNEDTAIVGDRRVTITTNPVDFGFFEVYRIKPLAGRLFDRNRPADAAYGAQFNQPLVINETAARQLGFTDPAMAIGKTILWHGISDLSAPPPGAKGGLRPSTILAVTPDFSFGSARTKIAPSMYMIAPTTGASFNSLALNVRLDPAKKIESLAAIDKIWKRIGPGPIVRYFVDQFMLRLYVDTIVQGAVITACAIIALSIACLGLFALSAYTTERRTKEIGIRKAMGASSSDILKLLLWQFTKPVLWACLIALPLAWLLMTHWLEGFAYRVDLAPWTFVLAAAVGVVIAWGTVFVHALRVARARPVGALRYE
jgi:putative ABC transport system permease protein